MLSLGKLHDSESTCTILDMPEYIALQQQVSTCLNLFRFNMIQIVTIHAILKHVWTCSNMSKLVQNHEYDTNWYNSWTCQDWKWKHGEIH